MLLSGKLVKYFAWLNRIVVLPILLVSGILSGAALADEPVEVEMAIFEGGEGLAFFLYCAREYEKINPNIKINMHGDPRNPDKMRIRILEGSVPEITNADMNQHWALIRNDDILALDEYLDGPNWEGDATWRDSFLPGSLDFFSYDGSTYACPFFYTAFVVWYNRGMFEENGWEPPKTWDEFLALCERIKAAGVAPIAFQGRYPSYAQGLIYHTYYHQAGPEALAAQLRIEPGSFDNPELVETLRLVQTAAVDHFQPGAMGMSHTEAQMQFLLGNTAMVFCGTWLKSEMTGKFPDGFRLGTFNLPFVPAGKADPTAVQGGTNYYVVFKNSKHPDEAVEFLRFMTSRSMAGEFARQRDFPVAVRGANEGNLSADLDELIAVIDAARTGYSVVPQQARGHNEMEQVWTDVRFKLLTGKISPEAAAALLEDGATAVRNRLADPDRITVRHRWKPLILLLLIVGAAAYWIVGKIRAIRQARRAGTATQTAGLFRIGWGNILLFLGPAVLLYTVFVIIPCLKSFAWSVHLWDGLTDMTFKGLLHFKRLFFESDSFWIAIKNNLFFMFIVPLFVLPLSLFLAACINRRVAGAALFRVVFFLPNILGGVAAALLWMHMYNPQGGVVNRSLVAVGDLLSAIGLTGAGTTVQELFASFAWLSPEHLYWAIIPMSIWAACGFNMLLFLAAMEGIPPSLYESADLDGATPWQQFWRITFPLIREVFAIALVFMFIGGMKVFEVIWLLTNQSPTTDTHVIGTLMVRSMFTEFKVGESTAIAVVLFLIVFVGTAATLRLMRRESVEF